MRSHSREWLVSALLCVLVVTAGLPARAGKASVMDAGWRVADQSGKSVLELHALVVNETAVPLIYHVRFLLESAALPAGAKATAGGTKNAADVKTAAAAENAAGATTAAASENAPADTTGWSVERTVTATGETLAPGASCPVTTDLPSDLLQPGRQYRCRAELVEGPYPMVAPSSQCCLTPRQNLWGAVPVAGVAALGANTKAATPSNVFFGFLRGTHTAVRVGPWEEQGSGLIVMRNSDGRATLHYTYTSTGENAATLVATMSATGNLVHLDGRVEPIVITTGHAEMTVAGNRTQVGQEVTRTGAAATGTFVGTLGGRPLSGVVTLTNGRETLNLASHTGVHSFTIEFTPS